MEAFQLAWIAYHGLVLLIGLVAGGGALAKPAEPTPVAAHVCFFQEAVHETRASCPQDIVSFTLPDPDDHLMLRR